ncbi:uncharacterized protein LOC103705155 [Phoenix dactylifera]|uniref:Uncharacterized protein LOC103705155 n=1 Tax=Phoenix dactylifera TaxID=42345 RepID=A0A8B8ZTZ5_PHODC|nr:uncharacterized protein LOC103705155 [Phoenix dactylifera]XP_038976832.1 uncharacterized protein LOC103705155 [Phoenix dactylifera]
MMTTTTMMLRRGGDLNLNSSVQTYGDSIKEGLKQAMLQHEVIFRNQVQELHRLYWTQKNLMSELGRKESGVYTQFSLPPRKGSAECSGSAGEKRVGNTAQSGLLMASSTRAQGNINEVHKNGVRNFDLELPAEEFMRHPGKENGGGCLGVKGSVCGENATNSEWLKANMHAKVADDLNKGSCSNARVVIDLEEEPVELESNGEAHLISSSGLVAPINNAADKCGSPPTISSDRVHAQNHLHVDRSGRWGGLKSTYRLAELNESVGYPSIKPSTQKQQTTLCKRMHIDLNIAQGNESIQALPDTMQAFPSPSTSSSVVHHGDVWRESSSRCPKESSVTLQPDAPYFCQEREKNVDWLFHGSQHSHQASAVGTKVSEYNDNQYGLDHEVQRSSAEGPAHCYQNLEEGFSSVSSRGIQYSINITAVSSKGFRKPGDAKVDLSSVQPHSNVLIDSRKPTLITACSNNIEDNNLHASVGSTNLPPTVIRGSEDKQANHEGSEEDTVSSHAVSRGEKKQDECFEESSIRNKPEHVTGNRQCASLDKSAEGNAVLSITADSGTTQLDTPVAERLPSMKVPIPEVSTSVCLPENSFNVSKSKPEDNIKQQTTEAVEMDLMIVKAAETLLSMSSKNVALPVDQFASNGQVEVETEEGSDQPAYSSDSFEAITLKLQEIIDDGQSMPAKPTEKETGNDACGVKLRRGRRLRDFQKDILPGLVSLSRHEICEDLHTIGYELRRNRSRKSCGETWFAPVRSRRSRRYAVGRRR